MEVLQIHVQQFRLAQGMSLRTLATQTGIPLSSLRRKERGEARWRVDELHRCARALGVCLCQIVTTPPKEHP